MARKFGAVRKFVKKDFLVSSLTTCFASIAASSVVVCTWAKISELGVVWKDGNIKLALSIK